MATLGINPALQAQQRRNPRQVQTRMRGRMQLSPDIAAVVTKAVADPAPVRQQRGDLERAVSDSSLYALRDKSLQRGYHRNNNDLVCQILPDVAMACQIFISAMQSPRDMVSQELVWRMECDAVKSTLGALILEDLKTTIEKEFDLRPVSAKALTENVRGSGALPYLVIPENAVDEVINNHTSLESWHAASKSYSVKNGFDFETGTAKHLGALQNYDTNTHNVSLESHRQNTYKPQVRLIEPERKITLRGQERVLEPVDIVLDNIKVIDNPFVLFKDRLMKMRSRVIKQQVYGQLPAFSMESFTSTPLTQLSDEQVAGLLYRNRARSTRHAVRFKGQEELSRVSISEPLCMEIPAEAVQTIFSPNKPEEPIGAFILLDRDFAPLRVTKDDWILHSTNSDRTPVHTSMLKRAAANFGNESFDYDPANNQHRLTMMRLYAELIEKDMFNRVRAGGLYGESFKLARNNDFYNMMLTRYFAGQHTQILFVPGEYLCYFALKFDENGAGVSLLEQVSTINMYRCMLKTAHVVGGMKNAVGRTILTVNAGEDVVDPIKLAQEATDTFIESKNLIFPTYVPQPNEMASMAQRSAIEVKLKGADNVPDFDVDIQTQRADQNTPDMDFDETLRRDSCMGVFIPPEIVDSSYKPEFAAQITADSVIISKNVMHYQGLHNRQLSKLGQMYVKASPMLTKIILERLRANPDQILLEDEDIKEIYPTVQLDKPKLDELKIGVAAQLIIRSLCVELPKPASVTLENQLKQFEAYSDACDSVLEKAMMSDEFFVENISGKVSGNVGAVRAMYKAAMLRDWMMDHGFMTELLGYTASNDERDTLKQPIRETLDYLKGMVVDMTKIAAELHPVVQASDADMDRIGAEPGSGSGSSSGSSSSDEGGGEDDFGGFDMGLGGSDETSTDKPVAQDEPEEPAAKSDDEGSDSSPAGYFG